MLYFVVMRACHHELERSVDLCSRNVLSLVEPGEGGSIGAATLRTSLAAPL